MRFTEFISELLDQRRGLQSKLARRLGVSRSTITAWRNGAKPEFEMCLRLANHLRMDPPTLFRMVGNNNYETIYRQSLEAQRIVAESSSEEDPSSSKWSPEDALTPLSEEDLYPNPRHAEVHRELQRLLDYNSAEAKAVATMIHMAARQLEAAESESEGSASATPRPERDADR